MSSKDDLFGESGRTVVRPARHSAKPAGSAPAARDVKPAPTNSVRQPEATVVDQGGAGISGWRGTDTVIHGISAAPATADRSEADDPGDLAAPPSDMPADSVAQEELISAAEGIRYPAGNPLMSAAAPLLVLLGNLRLMAIDIRPAALAERLAGLIEQFGERIARAGVPESEARIATFALCEIADDIIQNLPGFDRDAWMQHGMLKRFFRTTKAGIGFFEALNKLLSAPEAHLDMLELMHACLSLGFEGQYRGTARQGGGLDRVRRDVHDTLRYFRTRPEDISPHWQPTSAAVVRRRVRLPLWTIAAAACAIVAGAFFAMRTIITDQGEALAAELLALKPSAPVHLQHAGLAPMTDFVPMTEEVKPSPPTLLQIDRIRAALAKEIAEGVLTVGKKGDFVVVKIGNQVLFDSGQAELKPEFGPVAASIAQALAPEKGTITIVGHTDNVKPSRSSIFKSNYDLSVARAQAVEKALEPRLGDAKRLSVEGKGEDEPIADNSTPEGRALNRRVDVMVMREEVE
jgi:type VI secretion system protein ImpK